ncbi:MAG: domain S-box [Anaerophaga sp.]|nr:domain S-box [Anaerophaga sp.]
MKEKSPDKEFLQQARLDRFCIDHAGIGIYQISDESGKILSVNRQACIDLGYTKDELLNMTVFDLDPNFLKAGNEKWHQHRQKIRKKGTGTIETLHKRKDGSLMPVEVTITYLDFDGMPLSFSFARDITRRKITEKALKESEELFRTTLYSIGDGVITCDTEGKVMNINKVAEELTGWQEVEAKGQPMDKVFRIINECSRKPVISPVNKVFAGGKIVGLANHTLLQSRDGREIPIADSGAPIFSEDGRITGVVLVFRDQTEERRYQLELEKSRNYLSTLMNNLPGMAFRCKNTPTWDMEFVSSGSEELTGYKPGELINNQLIAFGNLIHPEDQESVWRNIQKAINKRSSYQVEYRIFTKYGTEKWVWEKGEAVRSDNGQVDVVEGFITDISERKNFEEKLTENDRLKTAFLQNVSHEIRTPLNAILGFTELIRQRDITEKERNDYIEIVQTGGQKLLNILNNVLELSRIETGDIKMIPSTFQVNKLCNEMLAMFTPQAEKKGLTFKYITKEPPVTTIFTDYTKLDQILTNLLNNAIKYTEKGKIEFGYSRREKDFLFFVKDTGIGITEEQQAKVFDRFYRSDDPKAITHDGVGLGLSICLALINNLGGKIWLESEPGKGTDFYFSLPIR